MSSPNWWGDWRPNLTPHTGNLLATDLIECTMIVGGLPVNTVITGAQILGAVPTPSVAWGSITGTLSSQTDLNTALSGKASTGAVTGTGITMSTARILGRSTAGTGAIEEITIGSGLTLSAGTLTASGGGLTVGTTAIASGTIGRVLFQGTGNVLQQSANLFWDNTNNRLGIGTSSPNTAITVTTNNVPTVEIISTGTTASTDFSVLRLQTTAKTWNIGTGGTTTGLNAVFYIDSPTSTATPFKILSNGTTNLLNTTINNLTSVTNFIVDNSNTSGYSVLNIKNSGASGKTYQIAVGGNTASSGFANNLYFADSVSGTRMTIYSSGNLGIGTTTDAGFKLDVNGSSRASSLVINGTAALFNSGISVFQNSTNRAFSVSASVTKSNGAERILFSLNSSELTNQQAMDFGYIGASSLTNRYFYLQSSESGVGYGGGVVLQHNGGWASVGSSSYIASAVFHVASTNRGFLPPRMTNAQMLAIATPAAGLIVYDTTNNKHCGYNGTAWQNFY